MQDIKVEQLNDASFDVVIDNDNKIIDSVDGMETAFNFQLFVDRRSTADDISLGRRRQGWMGDLMTKQEGYEVGSLLYLKNQSRNTQADRNEVAAYAEDALSYFVSIGAAKEVTAGLNGDNIEGTIKISRDETERYTKLWSVTNGIES